MGSFADSWPRTFSVQDWDSMFYNNLLSIPVLVIFSLLFEDWSAKSLELNLYGDLHLRMLHSFQADFVVAQPSGESQLTPLRDDVLWARRCRYQLLDSVVRPYDQLDHL